MICSGQGPYYSLVCDFFFFLFFFLIVFKVANTKKFVIF
jgi:hypothetical protein